MGRRRTGGGQAVVSSSGAPSRFVRRRIQTSLSPGQISLAPPRGWCAVDPSRARQNDAASRVHISRGVRPQGRPPRRPRGAAAPADPMPQRARVPGARGPAASIGNDPPRVVVTFSPPPFLSHPQGAELMAKYGVRVPPGIACKTPDEVAAAAAKLGGASGEVVVKSQVRPRTPTTRAAFKNTTPRARARPLSPPSRPVVPRRI